jgi:hypothetical protein
VEANHENESRSTVRGTNRNSSGDCGDGSALVADAQNFQLVLRRPIEYEFNNTLFASSASSPNDIWAVGNTTIHFDGNAVDDVPRPRRQ